MQDFDFVENLKDRGQLKRLTDFIYEVGMLRKSPRTGYQFLGSGAENVAEHSFRTTVIGYILATLAGANVERTVLMCLFHDLHEARTGDFNYVSKRYNSSQRTQALRDCLTGTGLAESLLGLWEELDEADTLEAELAQDADQLDFIANLKEEMDLGNPYASKWMSGAVKRLRTPQGKELSRMINETDHTDWWFLGPDPEWWNNKNGKNKS